MASASSASPRAVDKSRDDDQGERVATPGGESVGAPRLTLNHAKRIHAYAHQGFNPIHVQNAMRHALAHAV